MKICVASFKMLSKGLFWCILFMFLLIAVNIKMVKAAEEKWPGVDSAVVEKYAKRFGVEPKEPFINTDQGDLLLFIFTLAGTVGGFVMGYNFRKIFKEKQNGSISRT